MLLLACTAKVAAFAQTPAGEAGCVDMDPDVIQSAYAQAIQGAEVEGVPTITSCADMASNGGCADEELAASCCASCALPQRMTYGLNSVTMGCLTEKIICLLSRRRGARYGKEGLVWTGRVWKPVSCSPNMVECKCLENAYWNRPGPRFDIHKCLDARAG